MNPAQHAHAAHHAHAGHHASQEHAAHPAPMTAAHAHGGSLNQVALAHAHHGAR